VHRAIAKRVDRGLTNHDYVRIEELQHMGGQILSRVQHFLDTTQPSFARLIGKAAYVATLLIRLTIWLLGSYLFVVAARAGYGLLRGTEHDFHIAIGGERWSGVWLLILYVAGWILVRRVLMRLDEVDLDQRRTL
jgi:hypothetical protein